MQHRIINLLIYCSTLYCFSLSTLATTVAAQATHSSAGTPIAQASTQPTQYTQSKCLVSAYKNDLYWDRHRKFYWSWEGRLAVPMNTCAKHACHYLNLKNQEVLIPCLARPDNNKQCRVPCHSNKAFPASSQKK